MKAADQGVTTMMCARDTSRDDAQFVDDVREALDAGHIFVAYQPIVELGSKRLQKVEALARWVHPTRGVISPCDFIPRAEQTGVIDELGAWILKRACSEIVALRSHGIDIDLNVNLSVVELRHPAIAERTAEILARSGLAPNRLWIELTEGVFLEDEAVGPLMQLHDLGVHLVIDDFGTGFSNFQYISRLPISGLKIDRGFLAGLGVNRTDTAIVRSMTNLGRELGLQIVVEGVETESQRSQLQAMNCRLAQGWLFAPALRPSELLAQFGPPPAVTVLREPEPCVDEVARVAALQACKVLDTAPEPAFDALAHMASKLLETPMALVSLVDAHRQWFKASIGVDLEETTRELSFCHYAITDPCPPFVVADALADNRFSDNALVVGPPTIRAYAAAPIRSRENLPIGTLCVLDTQPREFTPQQLEHLTMLAAQASTLLDLRRRAEELNDLLRTRTTEVTHPLALQIDVVASGRGGAGDTGNDQDGSGVVHCGGLAIDTIGRRARLNGRDLPMTSKEFDLLTFLVGHAGEVFTRSELLDQVWRSSPSWQSPATVTEHVYRLRSKIEDVPNAPRVLCTVRGLGYRLVPPPVTEVLEPRPRSGSGIQVGTRIVAVDAGALALFAAVDPSEVIGRDIFDFVAPVSRPSTRARRTMRAAGKSPFDQLIMLRRLDGTEVMVRVGTETIDFVGEPALRVTLHEVTDHRLGLLPDIGVDDDVDADDAVIVTDTDFHVLSWSRGAERLYGWLEPEVLGHSLDDFAPAHDQVEAVDPSRHAGAPSRWGDVVPLTTRNGAIVAARASMQPLCGPDGLIDGIVMVHRLDRDAPPANSVLAVAGLPGIR